MREQLLRWLRMFGRPRWRQATPDPTRTVDARLTDVEHKQRSILARLRLLERQADPRDWQHHG